MKRVFSALLVLALVMGMAVNVVSAAVLYGDVNGDGHINNRDLGLLQQYLGGWDVTVDVAAADVTADGSTNNRDLGLLQQYLGDLDVQLGFDGDFVEPMPEWPYLWIIYESGENYANGEVPIYFKLEGFKEVPFDWVKETTYTAYGFSVVGDITVERDVDTGAIIYRMVLAHDGVTRDPSFFFSVVTADGMKQTDGLYGYPAAHGFFVSPSYDSAFSASQYYLVETGVITHDEYQAIMEKYWSQFGFEFSIVVDDNSH